MAHPWRGGPPGMGHPQLAGLQGGPGWASQPSNGTQHPPFWLGHSPWLGKEAEQVSDDKDSYAKVIFVQLMLLAYA